MSIPNYEILLTPLVRNNEYGTEVGVDSDLDITDFLENNGISSISRELDQGDFSFGIFNYGQIDITLNNKSGKFNERKDDSRSIFPWIRDRAKIEITFSDTDSTENISFKGLLTDRATTQEFKSGLIFFTVLSLDSIFQQIDLTEGTIPNGTTFKQAFNILLGSERVQSVLTYDGTKINPELDLVIDVGGEFDNLILKDALDLLLKASNSILEISSSDEMIVRSREANSNTPHEFFANDIQGRDNILDILNYNTGAQRMFNYIVINGFVSKDELSITNNTSKQLPFDFNFITALLSNQTIADSLLSDLKDPLLEFHLVVKIDDAKKKGVVFLDKVKVSVEFLLKAESGYNAAMYEIDEYEKSKYPIEVGSLTIDGRRIFKVTGLFDDPNTFQTTIKLRDTGVLV